MKLILISLFFLVLLVVPSFQEKVTPLEYPNEKQYDEKWKNDEMGTNGQTIGQVGCLMSSVSNAIAGHNILIDGETSNPDTLNQFLRANDGYTADSGLRHYVVVEVNSTLIEYVGAEDSMTRSEIIEALQTKTKVLLPKVGNPHWVLLTGYDTEDESIYYVSDPGYAKETTTVDAISEWRIYTMDFQGPTPTPEPTPEPSPVRPVGYTHFDQCDDAWGDEIMGDDQHTICDYGDFMTSLAMALNGHNIKYDDKDITPKTFNGFLQQNEGYSDGYVVWHSVAASIDEENVKYVGKKESLTRDEVIEYLSNKTYGLIMDTEDGFYLCDGYDEALTEIYYVLNPSNKLLQSVPTSTADSWRVYYIEMLKGDDDDDDETTSNSFLIKDLNTRVVATFFALLIFIVFVSL
ncbi:hypothetical protein M0813_09660 [Anaeramoeba flamelloides]|uniref:Peptidase C39-like domain-containing protein n=1 Tax=Anaeramoeba flamelloides TaxID=1746091 RepID=A0ABQ8X524_9EUKA|nr:hypothetical protein M0813_09660 [Anaeramoeba flamelloides]